MATARSAWGIDVGNRALKAIKLARDGDQIKIDDFEIIEHESILSDAGDNKESLLQSSLANFLQRHEPGKLPVGVGVAGQASFARFIKLPPVEAKKIPEIVRFEAVQQIPFPLDDVEWSYQLFQEDESPDVEVGIFAMRKELVNKQIGYFTGLGLNVQVVQINPLAIYNAMYFDKRISGTTMFMDIGAENTDLVIAEGETVWLRTLPIAGNNFTEALAKQFKLTFAKAEDLKRNAATSKYARQIFQAMRPVFADLVSEVQRSIGFYASVHREARIKRIISLGSTFRLPGLQKYLQQNLQLPVERLDAFGAGMPSDGKQAGIFNENMLSLAGAYGLALQAMGETKITASLLPESIRRTKIWQEKTKWFATAAAVVLAASGAAYGRWYYENLSYNQNSDARTKATSKLAEAKGFSADWSRVTGTGKEDRDLTERIIKLGEGRGLWPLISADIHAAVPSGDPKELLKLKRADRPMVVLTSLSSVYMSDISKLVDKGAAPGTFQMRDEDFRDLAISADGTFSAPLGGGAGPGPGGPMGGGMGPGGGGGSARQPAGGSSGSAKHGFVITITGRTPNSGSIRFVEGSLIRSLLAPTGPARPYVVARYIFPKAVRITASPTPGAAAGGAAPWGGGAGGPPWMGGAGGGMGGGFPAAGSTTLDDPMFPEEKLTGDTDFTVRIAVVLPEPAKAP